MNRVLIFAAAAIPMLADASLKGAALLVLAGGCVLVMRRASASARHMVWLAAMVALLIVPVLSVVLPGWRVLPRWSARDAVVAEAVVPRAIEKPAQTALPMERPTVFPAVPPLPVPEAVPVLRPNVPVAVAKESVMPILHYGWLLPIWAAGCSVLVLRLAAAHVLLRRSTRRCESADGALVAALEAARVESGVSQSVRLLLDKDRTIPVVWGIFRPQLLLPAEAEQWNATQLRSVLLHELAHLRRRDPLTQLLTQLACALHWFNPLVWLAAWRLHVERERACDDLVLARGVKPSAYAEHLLQIATQLSPARWTQACGLAMARKSSIEGRLHAVLSDKLNRRSVTRALTAAALMLGTLIAVPLAMLRAADEKWNPPGGAHIGGNDFSAVCVHDGKESSFVIAYRGDFDSMSNGGSNAKARTWTNSGTITLKKPGVVLSYHRVHTAPGKLSLTTGPSEGRDLGRAAPPHGNFGQKEYDLAKGRVFLLSDDATVRQLDLPTPLVTNWENAEKLAQLIAERLPEEPTDMARPKHKDARALYELWQRHARLSGDIPGALIGELAAAVKVFIGYNPTWETVPKLNEILPRLDASHDWKAADAIALLDEVAVVQDSPLQTAAEKMTAATIRQGEALPERFASATWGETQSNGLRAAWVLEPMAAEHRMGMALKARLLVQNAGTIPVMVRVPTWHQGAVSGRDATGAEVEVSGIEWTTIARLVPVRLGPGEYIEINAPGVGLGKDAGRGPWAGPRVGSNVLAMDGGELILTHGLIPLDGSGVGMREDAPHLIGPGWWEAHIKARLARELPLPASGAKRTHLLDRAVRDLFATTPTADEIAAFATDQSDGAFDALVQRLAARADRAEFSGSLPTAPVKFRVLPADPGADKTPRVVLGPGEYPLSGGTATSGAVTLKIVGRPVGDRRTNDAQILFEATEATGKLPPSPHKLEIPDGWGTWAIVCRPGEGFIYLLHKDGARKIDYSDPAKVTDLPATVVPVEFRDEVKRQLDLAGVSAESLAEVFEKSAPPASETGEARPPERTHLWNEKYAAVAYQTEKDVSFVLVHGGFISTGIGESSSQTSGKWSIEGNIHLVDSKLTAAAGKNVDKRVIAVKHTSDEPGTLYLDGKAYALGAGRVFVLGDNGEPFQTARSMALRTKEDLVKIGDMVMDDMKRLSGTAAAPKTAEVPAKAEAELVKIPDDQYVKSSLPVTGVEGLVWNEPENGLSLGYRIIGDEWRILGKQVKVELWVRNSGDKDVKLQVNWRPDIGLRLKLKDGKGEESESTIVPDDRPPFGQHRLLPPGHALKVKEFPVSLFRPINDVSSVRDHFFPLDPGQYTFHCELELPGFTATGEGGKQLTPAEGEWTGKLMTRELKVSIVDLDSPAPKSAKAGLRADVKPVSKLLFNEDYAALAVQSEKDVNFVLFYQGDLSSGISEWSSGAKWRVNGNVYLVDPAKTAVAGKNVNKRAISVQYTSDEPGTLYLDGKAYALSTGRVFVLGDAGEPFQTARSMALRTKEDLVKIGDMVIADMKRAQPATTPEPKQTGAVLPITDGKSSAQVLRADGYEPIVILIGRALTVLPESSSREGGLTMDVATSDKTITVRYIWPEDAPGFLGLKAGGYPVSRFDLSRGRVFYVHFEKMEFAAEIFQVPAGVKVPAIDSPAALTAAAAAVTAWYASCDDRARWESSRVVVPESEFKSGKPLDAAADKIVWGEASDAGLRLGIGGLEPGVAYPVGQSLPVKHYIRNDSGKTIGFSPTQIFNEGVGGELVRKADGKKFPHQRGYPGQGFFDRVRLAPGHYIELGSGPMRTIMAEKDGSSPGGMDMMAHGFTVLPGEYTLQLTHGIGQFLGRPANSHFGDPRNAPGLGEWTGVLTSAAVPLRLADEQVKTAKAGDSEAFGSQYMIAFDKGVIRLRHYKGYPGMSHSGGPWEDGSRDWKIPAADGEYVAAWAVGGKGLWVKDASGITHLIVKDNLTENGKWTLEQASGGRGDIPAGVRAALQLPPATAEPFDFKRLPNSEGAAMMEGGFFEMALSEGRVLKVPQKGSGFFIESGGRAYGPADGNPVIELGLAGLIQARLSETPNTAGLEMLRHMIADGRGSIRDCAFRLLPDLKAPQSPFDYDAVFWAMIGAAIEDENGPKDLTPEARMGYAWMHGLFHSTRLEWERTRPLLGAGRYQSGETVSADAGIVWTAGPDGMSLGISGLRGGASLEIGKSVPVVVYLRNDTEVPVKLSVPAQHNPVLQISLTDAAGKAFRASYPFSPGVTGYRHYELAAGTAVKVAVFDLEAHATPDDASRAAHKEGKEHNPRLAVPVGSYEAQIEYRNYQESPVPKDGGAEWTGKVTGSPVPLTIATAVAAPAPEAPKTAVKAKPQNESAQSLFRKWQAGARTDGKIPGGLIGELARTMDDAVKQITDAGVSAKLAALRPRLDASRDWTQAEVVALLDEITAIATAPVSWADDAMQSSLERVVRQGEPLPKELESAAWGAPAANGLRAAWLLEPGAEQYPLGSVLKARVLFHNVGKEPVVFETETWHQDDGHTARDGQGAEMPVKATWFTGITPRSKFRLAPGEYCEVSGHGLAIGAGEYKEERSTGAVGAIIEAKEGEMVTLSHSVDAGTGGWTRPDDLWVASIARRVGNEAPMPASTADREQLIRRVTLDILGDPPTAEEIAAFAADASADALEKLIKRLQAGGAAALPWKGRLPTGETKFRVVAADPDAAKRPRSASAPGRYVLGDGVHLQVTQVTEGDRRMNSAEILFFGPDPRKESPHKPYVIALPEGERAYGIGWVRGAGELWVIEKDLVRRYDFRDPGAVKEVKIESGSIGDVPGPLRGAMHQVFGELAASGQQQRAPAAGARRADDWGKFPAYDELDRRFVPQKALELAAKAELDSDEVRSLMFMILQASVEKAGELQPLLKDEQLKRKDDEYHSLALALAAYDYSLNGNREALQFLLDQLANGPAGDVQAAVPFGFIDEWELTIAAHEKHFARGADGAAGEAYGLSWEQRSVLYPEQFAKYQEKALKASGLDPESRRGVWTGSKDGVSVALRFGDDVSWRVNKGEGLGTAAATTLRVLPDVTATHLDVMVAHGKEGWVPCGRVSRGAGGGLRLEIWPHTSAAPFLPRVSGLELTKRPSEVPGVSREAVLLDSDVEARLAWGEPVNGLRAALVRISPGGDVKPGTVIDLNVLVQNVSDQPVPFRGESPVAGAVPRIVLADGTVMDAGHNIADILSAVNDLVLPPRHVVVMTLMSMAIGEFGPDTRSADPNRSVGYSTGKREDGAVVAGVTASLTFGHGPANAWKGTLKTGQLSAGRVAAGPVQPASK